MLYLCCTPKHLSIQTDMAVSFRLVQRKHKKNKQGESPIYLRITQDRKSNYISTGVVVFPKQWNDEKERVRSSHPIADALNQRLSRLKIDAQEQIHLGKSAEEAKKELAGVGGDFVRFANERIRGFKDEGKVWQAKKLQTTLLKCQAVWGKQIAWSKITPKAIDELNSYMRTVKGNGVNTRRNDLQRVKRLFKHAIRQGEVNANDDPFIVYQMEKKQKTRKRKLSPQEIKMIEDVELSGFEAVARDTFLFAYYGGGIRWGDVCVLRKNNIREGRLIYTTAKNKKALSIPLPPQALGIIGQYGPKEGDNPLLFPLLEETDFASEGRLKGRISSRNAQANSSLKKIALKAGVDPDGLATHIARHSFADLARRVSGGNIHAIMQTLGHSDVSITQMYLESLDLDAVDQLADQVWGNI